MKALKLTILSLMIINFSTHADVVQDTADEARQIYNQQNTGTQQNKDTINPGARTGAASQGAGAGANAAAAGALLAACLAPCPSCAYPLCAMSALAAQQAGHDKGAQKKSNATAGTSNWKDYEKGTSDFKDPNTKAALDKLKEGGYALDEKGLTTPNGSFIPASSLGSSSALLEAGLDPKMVDTTVKTLAAVNADAAKSLSVGVNSYGGGGGSVAEGATNADSSEEDSNAIGTAQPFATSAEQRAALLEGKIVMLDGEPIGVSGGNIFDTVHKAYQARRQGKQFIDPVEPVTNRAPASTTRRPSYKKLK